MNTTRIAVVSLVVLFAGTAVVVAQPASTPAGGYLQVGPVVTIHNENAENFRTTPPLSTPTVGASLALGGWVAPGVALEAEAVVDGAMSDAQTFSTGSSRTDYTAESRDILLGANVRVRAGRSPIEFTAGGGWAFTRFARRNNVTTPTLLPGPSSSTRDSTSSTTTPTAGVSLAVVVPVSPRVQVVPSIGGRWIRRDVDSDAWSFGMGRYMMSIGATVRFRS